MFLTARDTKNSYRFYVSKRIRDKKKVKSSDKFIISLPKESISVKSVEEIVKIISEAITQKGITTDITTDKMGTVIERLKYKCSDII